METQTVTQQATRPPAIEECFTTEEIARAWKWEPDTIRKIFMKEPGIISTGDKRKDIRIPLSVLERVRRRLTGAAKS